MTRDFERKETERQQYEQDYSATRALKAEIDELKKEVAKLKKKVKKLKKKSCHEVYVPLTDEQMKPFEDKF